MTNKKVIPCRISILVLAGNKVYCNNFLICEWKPTKFDILAYIATPYKYCFIIFSSRGVVEISKIAVFWRNTLNFKKFARYSLGKFYKTTFVGLAYLGSHIKFEGLSLTNKKVIPCRISISLLAGNKVYGNNFLICEWKPTKFDILAYIATPYKYCFIIFSSRGVVEISKIAVFWRNTLNFKKFARYSLGKFYKTTFVGLAYLGSHIKFEGLSLTNKKVIPCRISIPVLAGNKVYSNNFLICEWKPTKFNI